MEIGLYLTPVISIIAGLLILAFPNLLRFLIGSYLILIGILSIIF